MSLLPDSFVETDGESPTVVDFTLAGTPYQIINGGPHFQLTEAASICVLTKDQEETDRLWAALTADDGSESMCGWLKDRWGVSWQIVPEALVNALSAEDRDAAARAQAAMMEMHKIDIAKIESAFNGH